MSTNVALQMTKLTKSFIAHVTFIRFLVRVRTHVDFQITKLTKSLLAHVTFVRFLVRVNTHVSGQIGLTSKHLLANIALVPPSLSLHSFLNKSRFLFSHLILLHHGIVVTRHARENPQQSLHVSLFFSSLLLPITLQNRPRVHPARCGCGFFFLIFASSCCSSSSSSCRVSQTHSRRKTIAREKEVIEVNLISQNDCPLKEKKKRQSKETSFKNLEIESFHHERTTNTTQKKKKKKKKKKREKKEKRTKCRNRLWVVFT